MPLKLKNPFKKKPEFTLTDSEKEQLKKRKKTAFIKGLQEGSKKRAYEAGRSEGLGEKKSGSGFESLRTLATGALDFAGTVGLNMSEMHGYPVKDPRRKSKSTHKKAKPKTRKKKKKTKRKTRSKKPKRSMTILFD